MQKVHGLNISYKISYRKMSLEAIKNYIIGVVLALRVINYSIIIVPIMFATEMSRRLLNVVFLSDISSCPNYIII